MNHKEVTSPDYAIRSVIFNHLLSQPHTIFFLLFLCCCCDFCIIDILLLSSIEFISMIMMYI